MKIMWSVSVIEEIGIMSDYDGALKLKDINKPVTTRLDKYKPYRCPNGHDEYKKECPSCMAIYGHHGQKRRTHNT